jgi:hypothetical protein
MIYITLYYLYAVTILFIAGSATRRLLEKISSPQSFAFPPNIVHILILGIITLTTSTAFISIVLPISLYVHISIVILLLVYIFYDNKYFFRAVKFFLSEINNNRNIFILGCLCLFPALFMASGPVGYFDTGSYHAQAVKWINEYGTVPGLGNLHHRLAFNSSWFYFSAFFDMLAFDGKTSHLVNLIPITLGLIACFSGFNNIAKGNISLTNILKCFLAFPLSTDRLLMLIYLPTLSPDLVAAILALYAMILTVNYIENSETTDDYQSNSQQETFILIFCICFFLPTIKLNGLPALLFPLLLLIRTKARAIKMTIISCLVGGIILLPFLVGNVILSGYLIFPFPQIDLFTFDWKIPYQSADDVRRHIRYFAIYPTPVRLGKSIGAMSTLEWMSLWYSWSGNNPHLLWIIRASFAAIAFFVICYIRKVKICSNLLAIQSILILGIVYWFFSAPAYRLGKGWIWSFIIFSLGSLVYTILKSVRPRFVRSLSRVIFVLVSVALLNFLLMRWGTLENIMGKYAHSWWTVHALPEEQMRAVEIHEGFVVYVPLKEKAWNADLPNAPYVEYNLRMRGSTLKDGFRIAK